MPDDPAERDEDQRARWLMAQLLDYHHREARPVWWAFFERLEADPVELVDDADCVGELATTARRRPRPEKRSRSSTG